MPRKARKLSSSGIYHIMVRGIDKMQLFIDDADCVKFLSILDFMQDDDFVILAYCLMGNHYHLLVKTSKSDLTVLEAKMKQLGIRFASFFNHRYCRTGAVFAGRYKSQQVETIGYFLRVLRYIHANPVAAGIADTMDAYAWSSYQNYFAQDTNHICNVDINYALRIRPLDWLRAWHTAPEINARAMIDDTPHNRLTDADVQVLINNFCHCMPRALSSLAADDKAHALRRLVREENIPIAQLSRLTGISRGEIMRLTN